MEEEERKEVTVAIRVSEEEEEVVVVDESSERVEGVRRDTWPKRRPSMGPDEEENRCIREARVGPDIAIFSTGRSSMAEHERERDLIEE